MANLEELSDYDFERLVADLLSAAWDVDVQTFPRGRDGGVDLRVLGPVSAPLSMTSGQELVVQCKHRPNAKMAALRPVLRVEAAKPVVSAADRYVLVTSAPLTRANKKEIVTTFAGRVLEDDVYGRDDVAALLRRHPEVERAHLKLWLSSAAVLPVLVHQTEYLRSAALVAELQRLKSTLVETDALAAALAAVQVHHMCILSGPPGVGKTTTAMMVLLRHMAQGWRPAAAVGRVRELEDQLEPGVRQILFFDDFLGQNSLEAKLDRGEDAELLRLMHMVSRDPDKILVLTTRDYVLQQAKQSYEKLGDEMIDLAKVTVTPAQISPAQRAHILYNQLYYSPLREAAATARNGPRRYEELTEHRNYNPRLMSAAIASAVRDLTARPGGVATRASQPDVPAMLERALDDPIKLWDHVLRHQMTPLQLSMLIIRASLGSGPIAVDLLLDATADYAAAAGARPSRAELTAALKVVDGDLLLTSMARRTGLMLAHALNPGAGDAVVTYVGDNRDRLAQMIHTATTFDQVRWSANLLSLLQADRDARAVRPRGSAELLGACLAAAERTLTSTPVRMPPDAVDGWCHELAERLNFFGQLLERTGQVADEGLGMRIIPAYVEVVRSTPMDPGGVVGVVAALCRPPFGPWRREKTRLAAAAYAVLAEPDDSDDWENFADLIAFVPPTRQYLDEMQDRFEEFAEDLVETAESDLDGSLDEDDITRLREEMTDLDALARRLKVSIGADDVLDTLKELERELPEEEDASAQPNLTSEPRRPGAAGRIAGPDGNSAIFRLL